MAVTVRALATIAIACFLAPVASPPPAFADETAMNFAVSERIVVRSKALGKDVALRVRRPALGVSASSVTVVALTSTATADRLAAELRKAELEESVFGMSVVTIEGLSPDDVDPLAALTAGVKDAPAFRRFLTEELHPLLTETLGLGKKALLAGVERLGTAVLQAAIEDLERYESYLVFEPVITPEQADRLAGAVTDGLGGRASAIDLILMRGDGEEALAMERLLQRISEGSFYMNVDPSRDELTAAAFIKERVMTAATVPPY